MLIWGLRVACRLRLPCFLAWVGARLAKPLPGSQEEDLLSVTGPRGSGDSVPMATAGGPSSWAAGLFLGLCLLLLG